MRWLHTCLWKLLIKKKKRLTFKVKPFSKKQNTLNVYRITRLISVTDNTTCVIKSRSSYLKQICYQANGRWRKCLFITRSENCKIMGISFGYWWRYWSHGHSVLSLISRHSSHLRFKQYVNFAEKVFPFQRKRLRMNDVGINCSIKTDVTFKANILNLKCVTVKI